jgi:stage V sporulation protein K
MFKQLKILPSDRFEYTTAGNLLSRYMGGTSNKTVDALRRAKGGILFIDEAYACYQGTVAMVEKSSKLSSITLFRKSSR